MGKLMAYGWIFNRWSIDKKSNITRRKAISRWQEKLRIISKDNAIICEVTPSMKKTNERKKESHGRTIFKNDVIIIRVINYDVMPSMKEPINLKINDTISWRYDKDM